MKITKTQIFWFCLGLLLGYLLVANPFNAQESNTVANEVDYLQIAYDLYFEPENCEGNKIIARGLWFFIGGGEQIADFKTIDSYYAGGLEWLKIACPPIEEVPNG